MSSLTPAEKQALYEGVVCKGDGWNAKIKTFEYLNRLKHQFDDEWKNTLSKSY
jgi:hypothetical protein